MEGIIRRSRILENPMNMPRQSPASLHCKALWTAAGVACLAMTAPASLVAHYTFDENAGATLALEESGGTSGVIGASVVTGVTGISGNAYQFPNLATAAGIVDMGDATFFDAIEASQALTFSAWIKTTDTNNGRNVVVFAGSDTVANRYIDLGVVGGTSLNPGTANGRLRPTANVSDISEVFSTPTLVNNDEWRHLALTINLASDTISLYVDGALASTGGLVSETFPGFNNFEIGRLGRSGTQVDPFGGLVDDVQVYDHALSANQVQFLFNNPGMAVPEPGSLALAGLGLLTLARRRRG